MFVTLHYMFAIFYTLAHTPTCFSTNSLPSLGSPFLCCSFECIQGLWKLVVVSECFLGDALVCRWVFSMTS